MSRLSLPFLLFTAFSACAENACTDNNLFDVCVVGGVEGLLAVSIDGVFYIPCYDHNENIILYVSESGSIAAQYTLRAK